MRVHLRHFALLVLTACGPRGGTDWVQDPSQMPPESSGVWVAPDERKKPPQPATPGDDAQAEGAEGDEGRDPVLIQMQGQPQPAAAGRGGRAAEPPPGLFRNTYYDFPKEGAGAKDATLFDASCAPIAKVPRSFHDQVCVQGSGKLASGATVSFAKRGCSCAATCPRTGQQVCFEQLDPAQFPNGRGATGRPITPLRTIAVDSDVIPLGTIVFIPELAGLPRPDGTKHDGCFVAEDRGVKVVGRQVDVFTGDPALTARYNALFPSNKGVHVRLNEPRCDRAGR